MTEAYLYGEPQCRGRFKVLAEDFEVTECLDLPVSDPAQQQGEHQWLWVEKRGANTVYVAAQLAKFAGVKERDVSYSGLKDRHAVTYQWFSVQLPGSQLLDWQTLEHPEFKILQAVLQPRKLKTGTHRANRFTLKLRDLDQADWFTQRWQQLVAQGVPNYFGPQRFGRQGQNIVQAKLWFTRQLKRRPSRHQSSLYLSAARSFLFNQVLSARIAAQRLEPEIGDAMILKGSQSFFIIEQLDAAVTERFSQGDILLSGPLVGSDSWLTQGEIARFEQGICEQHAELLDGLRQQRIDNARRALLMNLEQPQLTWLSESSAQITFTLARGCFATSVLRELIRGSDSYDEVVS